MADPVDPNAEAPPIPPTATMTLDQWAEKIGRAHV